MYVITYMQNLKINMNTTNRCTDTDSKLMATNGEGEGGGTNWRRGLRGTHYYVKDKQVISIHYTTQGI